MLLRDIELVGGRVHIHFNDVDGSHETIVLLPAEALDLSGWLLQVQPELLRLNAHDLEEIRRKDNVG